MGEEGGEENAAQEEPNGGGDRGNMVVESEETRNESATSMDSKRINVSRQLLFSSLRTCEKNNNNNNNGRNGSCLTWLATS